MLAVCPPELIVIDDDPTATELVRFTLEDRHIKVVGFTEPLLALAHIASDRPELVLLDLNMEGLNGLEVLEQISVVAPTTDVIFITVDYSTENAVRAIQMGASDYWTKPLDLGRLRDRIDTWLADRKKALQRQTLDAELTRAYDFYGIVGRSPALLEMFTKMRRIAPHFQTVLVRARNWHG